MKLIIDIDENLICEGLVRNFTGDEKDVLINAIRNGIPYEEKTHGDCGNCGFRKFSEKFVDGVVDLMNKNDITSIEQLGEILKGGTEE